MKLFQIIPDKRNEHYTHSQLRSNPPLYQKSEKNRHWIFKGIKNRINTVYTLGTLHKAKYTRSHCNIPEIENCETKDVK